MNFRQWKKKVYHKKVKHGGWRAYKKELRSLLGHHVPDCAKYPNRVRIRQLSKAN